jgi:5-methylcytosine-specific restriction endonuclease McrA
MQKHTKNYCKFFNVGEQDKIPCEMMCGNIADDLHHINYRSHLGGDEVDNIIALCRNCHNLAHNGSISKDKLRDKHNLKIKCLKSMQNH